MARDQKVKVRIEATDQASGSIDKVEGRFQRLGTSIKANALKITAALASVAVAFRQIEKSAEQIGQKGALERNLTAQGIAINEFVGELKRLSDNQIATNELILSSNRALKLGIQADDLPKLMTVAANAAVELGISTTQAFADITTGIGRASPLILDNLGIVVDANQVYGDFAASIGVSTEALTKQQRTIALTKAVVEGASGAIEDFSSKQDDLTRNINRAKAAFDNLTSSAGQVGGGLVELAAGGLGVVALGISNVVEGMVKLGRGMLFLMELVPGLGTAFEGAAGKLQELDDGIDAYQAKNEQFIAGMYKGGAALIGVGLGFESAGTGADNLATKLGGAATAANTATGFFKTATEAAIGLGNALGEVTSIQLEQEILKINEALAESASELGRNSDEYVRLESIAAAKIESLDARIRSLRDGLGDLKTATTDAVDGVTEYARAASDGVRQTDALTSSLNRSSAAYRQQNSAAVSAGAAVGGSQYGTTPFSFSGGRFSFVNGRRAQIMPDGRVVYP
jgi:prefoldin subunit 5